MSRTSLVFSIFMLISCTTGFAQAQSGHSAMDETDWSRQQMEAERRRLQAERQQESDAFVAEQQELAERQETRRRMSAEEDRRLGPDHGGDIDPLRGREDTSRQIDAIRQRADNERGP